MRAVIDSWFYNGLSRESLNAAEERLGELLGGPALDPRYVAGMRDYMPTLCWRVLDAEAGVCCIRNRGHDQGTHEPEEA